MGNIVRMLQRLLQASENLDIPNIGTNRGGRPGPAPAAKPGKGSGSAPGGGKGKGKAPATNPTNPAGTSGTNLGGNDDFYPEATTPTPASKKPAPLDVSDLQFLYLQNRLLHKQLRKEM
ncbi:unnamed protein product, partial [Protopolystoma xenopodis]